jgi:BirA family biotin operon repressor/biotin-[acetyl-CoA-carboxylase] ligase
MDRAETLRRALDRREQAWPAPLEWHAEIGSTSDRLKDLARAGALEWTVVLADRQTQGRGREGRRWFSPPGGLYLSVLVRPRESALPVLPLAAGVAVGEAATAHGVHAELKWPNDVLAGGRKIGGVLCEASSGPSGVEWVVVGIGLNLLARQGDLGAELRDHATSFAIETGEAPDVEDVAADVLARWRHWYDAVRVNPAQAVAAWRARAVSWWGQPAEVLTASSVVRGRLRDVDEDGALIVDLPEGGSRRVLSGEVRRLRRAGER